MSDERLYTLRVEGKTYDELIPEVVKNIAYVVSVNRKKHGVLIAHNCSVDDLCGMAYCKLCNRTKEDGLSNLERVFIYTAEHNLPKKYFMSYISVSATSAVSTEARSLRSKKRFEIPLSLNCVYSDGDSESELLDFIEDRNNFMNSIIYEDLMNQIPNEEYSDYYFDIEGKKAKVTTRAIVELLLDGKTKTQIKNMLYKKEDEQLAPIKSATLLINNSLQQARQCVSRY